MDKYIKSQVQKNKSLHQESLLDMSSLSKNMSRQKQIELMMKEFIHKYSESKSTKQSGVTLPMINKANIQATGEGKLLNGFKSTNQSRIKLDNSLLPTSPDKNFLNQSQGEDAEFRNTKSVLASSIDHSDNIREQSFPIDLKFKNLAKKSPRRINGDQNSKRSQSQMASHKKKHNQTIKIKASFQLLDKNFKKQRAAMGTLVNQSDKITEDQSEQVSSMIHFNETFNPNTKGNLNSISQEEFNSNPVVTTQNGELSDKIETGELLVNNSPSKYRSLMKNESIDNSAKKRKEFYKMISSDYVPGPGTYNVSSSFIQTDRGKLSHKRHFSQKESNLNSSTSREQAYGADQVISVYSGKVSVGDGKFGLSFENVKKQYFKEYDVELYGRHSPGPGAYSPSTRIFPDNKFDQKTMSKEKRVCPIVPKQQQQIQASPFSYNQQISSFNAHKNFNHYFGNRAERKVDARLFGQQHAYVVKKGLF